MTTFDFKALVEQFAPEIIAQRRIPRATYRMQFHKGFTFKDAEALVPYLDALGISDLYTSPILKAVPGSTHGYDICDPTQLNPELGTPEDFARLAEALQARGMGLIMDIVPNHMGIGSECNAWWMDVLEKGPTSPYAGYFDIDWNPIKPELKDKVLLPILGDTYGNTLERGEIKLIYADGRFSLIYGERRLPVAPESYGMILKAPLDYLVLTLGDDHEAVRELHQIAGLETGRNTGGSADGNTKTQERLDGLYKASAEARKAIVEGVARFNGTTGDQASFDALDRLISMQHYRLAYWRVASEEINYRRFFDINTMAAIHSENPVVFAATHSLIFELVTQGQVTGLRIDHPDGLWNPPAYFRQLQENTITYKIKARLDESLSANQEADLLQAVTRWFDEQYRANGKYEWPLYTVAEKILSETEPLPLDWAVDGTTGYDFMNLVNGLFVDNASEARLSQIFADYTGRSATFNRLEYVSKKMIMEGALASEINALAHRLERLSEHNRHTRDFTLNLLLTGLREVIACLPIYRTYISGVDAVSVRDEQFVLEAVREAKQRNRRVDASVFDFVQDTLLLRNLQAFALEQRRDLIDFVMRVQQITPPVMAKSVEDTLFYVYNRLVSVNEVGGSPAAFGISWADFAKENVKRCRQWPDAMLATSTHDTKRSEDVRARLNALSELADEWGAALEMWSRINANHKAMVSAGPAPSANDEYLLYQTLLGTYPTDVPSDDYADRIGQYMGKAT
ncbi:MAG TPA: malto-oligosyltrehalose synthase, partial [Phototrophicaceae bacterium]|nr:malto-oligosyltrehalose synthase [Phototrophicaceae bacterium]